MGKDRFEDLDFIDFNDSRRQEGTVIADMLSAVYRNRKWFILSVAVCVLIGFLYLKSSPKIFLRTATVLVKDEQKGGGVNGAAAFQDLFSLGGSTVDNEVGIFKSKRLMRTVVETTASGYKLQGVGRAEKEGTLYVHAVCRYLP